MGYLYVILVNKIKEKRRLFAYLLFKNTLLIYIILGIKSLASSSKRVSVRDVETCKARCCMLFFAFRLFFAIVFKT